MKYTPTIGLEIHAELQTKSKMFCSCLNDPAEQEPNTNICPICVGHPGTLPVANEKALEKVIQSGLALNCKIALNSKFDRKNYFYPDLPKGYQISQYDMPLCEDGYLKVDGVKIGITRIHIEEDTGKLTHPDGENYSLVDFNRAGVPLMELVTEPDLTSSVQARKFGQMIQAIFRYIEASTANMEKGQMRVEANVSIHPEKSKKLGTKVEVKNLNSFRAVERAIEYEIERQTAILEEGLQVFQETRGWDEKKGVTFSQREKEEAHDYRYLPEPDLPLLQFSKEAITEYKEGLPELPEERKNRLIAEYKIDSEAADVFVLNKDLGEYFENVTSELRRGLADKELSKITTLAANYLITDLQGLLQAKSVSDDDFHISAENFAELILLVVEQKISTPAAKTVLYEMYNTGGDPSQIVENRGLAQVSNENEIQSIAQAIIDENPKPVDDYKKGKEQALKFLVGQMMGRTKGAVNPETGEKILQQLLK